ncbi:MAG TPA: NAD(P)/FAD-dependent oxidoreductase [Candidatus Pacearchaeota archaeon]|nr:NAD(P)/FAD-dependent oxidoreductase [Candidatus Pacearchaeota archaeon]HOK93983.1 NAD(P)/FAD-dependent oxidoreductase [Candidatus Pacearchaeota archaeon]HPO75054.1 NAD(P)/FAD-dependent oxidoreductase [Candidatus Pacearchaeota archaeon]
MLYDLIIVGGSAVGLYLASEFSKKGNSVLVLEKKEKIVGKVCSGLVSKNIFSLLGKSAEEILAENSDLIENKFEKARIWVEKKYFDFSGEAWLFNRKKLDECLFRKAKEVGVEVELQKEVVTVKEEKEFVSVKTKDGSNFQGKILAGCDGVLSTIAREMSLPQQKNLLLGVITYIKIPNSKFKNSKDDFPELFFNKDFPGFFAWQIPRKNCIEYGTALLPEKKPKERLEKWLTTNKLQPITNNLKFEAALIPSYPLKKTTTKRIFLCGDSAGQVKPYTGGGLIYGFTAAKIASTVINLNNPHLENYEKEWRKKLMPEIRMGNLLKKCYSFPTFLKITGVSFLNKLQKKGKLDQDKPLTIFKI